MSHAPRRIFITHCSAKKDESLKATDIRVTPDSLYTSNRIQAFMNACKTADVEWTIFSDKYGIWFPSEKHEWYELHPDKIDEERRNELKADFDIKLSQFEEILFYRHPARFHRTYRQLIKSSSLASRIALFEHVKDIKKCYG